jgi:hypothetical protein
MHAQKRKGLSLMNLAAVGSGELSRHRIWDLEHRGDPGREVELEYTDRRRRFEEDFSEQ